MRRSNATVNFVDAIGRVVAMTDDNHAAVLTLPKDFLMKGDRIVIQCTGECSAITDWILLDAERNGKKIFRAEVEASEKR